ncbi:hypothetical protein glysoja_037145 [Glycine soja]|uniref:Uncharacterized protein n=1 Tax=Glycine soja TaxID=3848 RepID=A0A0B2QYE6_GLYSO|nr:hypothetical protein glysoja_037145 [Glycine soja]
MEEVGNFREGFLCYGLSCYCCSTTDLPSSMLTTELGFLISFSVKGFSIGADLKGGLAFFVILKSFSALAFENITFENFAPEHYSFGALSCPLQVYRLHNRTEQKIITGNNWLCILKMEDHDEIDILASSIVGERLPPRFIGRKNQSTAWDHFDKLPDPNPLSQAKSHCGALIKYSSGTTSMCTHLDKCKKNSDVMSKRQKSDSSSTTITPSSSFMIDQEACRIALVKLFVALELSFHMVEHDTFRELFSIVAPFLVVISRTTLARDGGELTCKLRDKVESSLRSLFEEYSNGGDEFEVSSQEARAQPSERVENDPYDYSQYFQ